MDIIRQILRKLIPVKFYTYLSGLTGSLYVLFKEGSEALRILNSKEPGIKQVSLKTIKHLFYFRSNGSDSNIIIQNLIRIEYGKKINTKIGNGFIIDAGAYIGDVSCYFASNYGCRIISLEPNNESFELAFKNTSYYPQITLLKKGLWYRKAKLIVKGEGTGSEVIETTDSNYDIEGISIQDLINEYDISSIEILKIDIEGSEDIIFSQDISGWINMVKIILIEIHTESGNKIILNKLRNYNFSIERYRSIFYCFNNSPKSN